MKIMHAKKILVINSGSSSIKYKLYTFPEKLLIKKGVIEKIGEPESKIKNHSEGIKLILEELLKEKIIKDFKEISAFGHRVVHGGEFFKKPCLITKEVIEKIKECSNLAPLHNPANLAGILACQENFPQIPQVVVFDTAFHQTIPEVAYMYALPYYYYKKYGIRRYGFHGTSHQYVAQKASEILKKPLKKLKLITCHLGNGCSISAIKYGKSIDTSMGFTPLEGLIMGTRSGDIDPAIIFYIMEKDNLREKEVENILNKKSGLLGISGISNDMRVIKEEIKKKNKFAKLALDMFIYRLIKYIGSYYFILEGTDAIVFTAGIAENNLDIIKKIEKKIFSVISKKTKILVIKTDEELMIANLTYLILKEGRYVTDNA